MHKPQKTRMRPAPTTRVKRTTPLSLPPENLNRNNAILSSFRRRLNAVLVSARSSQPTLPLKTSETNAACMAKIKNLANDNEKSSFCGRGEGTCVENGNCPMSG